MRGTKMPMPSTSKGMLEKDSSIRLRWLRTWEREVRKGGRERLGHKLRPKTQLTSQNVKKSKMRRGGESLGGKFKTKRKGSPSKKRPPQDTSKELGREGAPGDEGRSSEKGRATPEIGTRVISGWKRFLSAS